MASIAPNRFDESYKVLQGHQAQWMQVQQANKYCKKGPFPLNLSSFFLSKKKINTMTSKHPAQTLGAIFLFLLFSITAFGQGPRYEISGRVVDDMGTPLEYATISITDVSDPTRVTGGVTDTSGNFSIDVSEGTYNIVVEFISFSPQHFNNRTINADINLGEIELGMAAADLDEVVVTAETTQVDVRLDKKIYNIGQDLTTAGGTVADALNNVPSVDVDVEGGISLRGNENVRILINGKPSAMAGFGDTDVLSQLPADAIERVEVITSPSARYDAEGTAGILNIILRQERTLGFNGSFTARGGYPDNAGLSANVNYRTRNFNLFNTTGFRYFDAPGNSYSSTLYYENVDDEGNIIPAYRRIEDRTVERLNRNFNTNLGIEYFLNDRSSITASGFFRYGEDEDVTTNLGSRYTRGFDLLQETTRSERQSEEDHSYQFALNYINRFNDDGHELTADFQYETDKETQTSFLNETVNFSVDDALEFPRENVFTEEKQDEYLIQADYVLPFGEGSQFEAGYRGNFEEQVTDYSLFIEDLGTNDMVRDDGRSNIFTYNENVNSLYTQYGTKVGDFSFLLGLRLEHTQLKGEIDAEIDPEEFAVEMNFDNDYFGLFPTVNLIYELGEFENITFGYNRRINRPRSWFVNPFPSRESRTNIFRGNPSLEPAFANAFDLGYLKRWDKLTFTTSVYYQREENSFQRIERSTGTVTEEDETLIIETIPVNFATRERIGAEAGLMYNPVNWLRLNGSVNFFQFDTQGEYAGIDYGNKSTSWFARFSSKVTLPASIEWQTNAFYRGASENIQGTSDDILSIDLAFAKDIFNRNATIAFNVRDLLNSRKRESFTQTEFFERDSRFQWRERSFTLSLTYRFNQQKMEQERQRRAEENGEMDNNMGDGIDF